MRRVILNLGDLHSKFDPYYNYGIAQFVEWLDKSLPDQGKDFTEVWFAGDLLDKVTGSSSHTHSVAPVIYTLKRKASSIYAILGNHDYGIKSQEIVSNKEFLESLGVTVITDPCEYVTKLGFKMLCLPWTPYLSYKEMNNFVFQHTGHYDELISHWEYKPLFTEDFVDISKVDATVKVVGHVHTADLCHYIGSILPNSSAEVKTFSNPSVIRMLYEDDNNTFTRDIPIPSFVDIKKVELKAFDDLSTLISKPDLFYKIEFDRGNLDEKLIKDYLKEHNIGLYKIKSVTPDFKNTFTEEEDDTFIEADISLSKKEIIEACRESLAITDKEFAQLLEHLA